jgi:AcrR family transcriptional regulator
MNKREIIFQAVLKLSGETSIYEIPMSSIAKDASVAVGSLYTYFETKDDLLLSLLKEIESEIEEVLTVDFDASNSPKDIFSLYWLALFKYFSTNVSKLLYVEHLRNLPVSRTFIINRPSDRLGVVQFFSTCQNSGELRPLPLVWIFRLFYDSVINTVQMIRQKDVSVDNNMLTQVLDAIWQCLKNE